ncbi:hypothetical protein [Kitasatospora sp. McL0602]|uniref:hypothetical protein n=1 Tax=Kitasatospora sp. McL0602 TaxID=3439530 RepID=UPI003F8CD17C
MSSGTDDRRPGGCLTGVVRAVALVVVVPVRLLVELLAVVLRPVGIAADWVVRMVGLALYWVFVWPFLTVWRYVLAPLGRVLVVAPLRWLLREVLAPVGRVLLAGLVVLARGFAWLVDILLVVPLRALYRYVLAPLGRAVAWVLRWLVAVPVVWLWETLLYPVLRVVGRAVAWAWRVGGLVWRFAVVRPCRWVRREVWWPVKLEVRRVLADVRRALLG